MLPLLGDDLDSSTLHLYLKDKTFVEYFNSFLLLPAFSSRLFFDQESGYFEPVHGEETKLCWGEGDGVTPTSSQATLYLTDDNMGPALDRHQSWSWIVEHRLPLFLRSDLYSEYKLCKLLSSQGTSEVKAASTLLTPIKSHSSTKLHSGLSSPVKRHCSDNKASGQTDTSLPVIQQASSSNHHLLDHEDVSSTSLNSSPKVTRLSASISDVELVHKRSSGALSKQRSKSVDLLGSHFSMEFQHTTKMASSELKLIRSKSGMSSLWKFLRGKAGEKNWLFWLDAERVSYHTSPLDQQRLLQELRERYLHSSGPLVLPAEIRNRVGVNKTSRLTLSQIKSLQYILAEGLRNYWCPRFLVHHNVVTAADTSLMSQPRPQPCPSSIVSFNNGQLSNYPRVSTPLTPTGTPTIRRLTSGRGRSQSTPTSSRKTQEEKGNNKLFSRLKVSGEGSEIRLVKIEGTPASRGHSRRIWDRDDIKVKGDSPHLRARKLHYNRVAKYSLHHVPDSSSRCASTMAGRHDTGSMCESQCTILSVSGTPLHTIPHTPTQPHTITEESPSMELYGPLITCLNTEHRKAGGYFQQHLENIEDKVHLYCLVFWREVQEYKALFIGASFSPCTVETKAKTLYGRFVAEGSEKSIECPQQTVSGVSANLWPAYEDLFDSAEEHALGMLLLKWVEMVTSEDKLFQKLDSATLRRGSGHVSHRVSPTLEELEEEEFPDELDDEYPGFLTPHSSRRLSRASSRRSSRSSSSASMRRRLSVGGAESRAVSLNDIMANREELDYFKMFLNERCAAQDLMCWLEIEAFRGIPVNDKTIRNMKAKQLKSHYFNKSYLFGPNSPATKEAQRQIVQAGGGAYTGRLPARPRTPVFIEAQKHVRTRLEKKWLAEFITTPEYISRNKMAFNAQGRRVSRVNGKDMPVYYENSFTNSHEAITLRKVLQDKHQVEVLLRYLEIRTIGSSSGKYSLVKQNVDFWLEVQRFKELCHAHTTDSMLSNKATAIIDCYFQSSAPPKLQVDVPLAVADELARKPTGPYLFREAQAAVFKHLYTCWSDFKNYSSGFSPDEIEISLVHLESQLLRDMNAEKNRRASEMLEEEIRRSTIPRFETLAEKEERIRMEKERAEIGDVQVAFRLSSPDHSYIYYTALPEDFIERQCTSEHSFVDSKAITSKEKYSMELYPQVQNTQSSESNLLPMLTVKSEKPKKPKKASVAQQEEDLEMDLEADQTPLKSNTILQRQSSRSFLQSRKTPLRSSSRLSTSQRVAKVTSRYLPHTTISMRRSGEKGGSPFFYGAGLPGEESSVTVTSVETLNI